MLVTWDVSHLEMSWLNVEESTLFILNIFCIVSTELTSQPLMPWLNEEAD